MTYHGTVSCRLKNRRIYLRRFADAEGNEVNCLTFKRLRPDRTIYRHHIHLSDEALCAIFKLRNYWQEIENKTEGTK